MKTKRFTTKKDNTINKNTVKVGDTYIGENKFYAPKNRFYKMTIESIEKNKVTVKMHLIGESYEWGNNGFKEEWPNVTEWTLVGKITAGMIAGMPINKELAFDHKYHMTRVEDFPFAC